MAGPPPEPAPELQGREKVVGALVGLIFALLCLGAIGASAAVADTSGKHKDDSHAEDGDHSGEDGDHSDDEDHSDG